MEGRKIGEEQEDWKDTDMVTQLSMEDQEQIKMVLNPQELLNDG